MYTLALINQSSNTVLYRAPARDVTFSTSRAGDERLRATLADVSTTLARTIAHRFAFLRVEIRVHAQTIWRGRVIDASVSKDRNEQLSIEINAVGYKSKLNDTYYTAMWSTADTTQVRLVQPSELNQAIADSRVRLDISDVLRVSIAQNSVFAANDRICVAYVVPNRAQRAIRHIVLRSSTLPFSFVLEIVGLISAPTNQTWSVGYTSTPLAPNTFHNVIFPQEFVAVAIVLRTPTPQTFTQPAVVAIDALRITSSTTGTTPVVDILRTALQPSFPHVFTFGINSFSDVRNAVFEDQTLADVLDELTHYDALEYRVVDERTIALYRANDDAIRSHWHVHAATLSYALDASTIANRVYVRYRDVDQRRYMRSFAQDNVDARAVVANNVVREHYVDLNTTDSTLATQRRAVELADRTFPRSRVSLTTQRVFTPYREPVPAWRVRAGDRVTIINAANTDIRSIKTIIVDRTDFNVATQTLTIDALIDDE